MDVRFSRRRVRLPPRVSNLSRDSKLIPLGLLAVHETKPAYGRKPTNRESTMRQAPCLRRRELAGAIQRQSAASAKADFAGVNDRATRSNAGQTGRACFRLARALRREAPHRR